MVLTWFAIMGDVQSHEWKSVQGPPVELAHALIGCVCFLSTDKQFPLSRLCTLSAPKSSPVSKIWGGSTSRSGDSNHSADTTHMAWTGVFEYVCAFVDLFENQTSNWNIMDYLCWNEPSFWRCSFPFPHSKHEYNQCHPYSQHFESSSDAYTSYTLWSLLDVLEVARQVVFCFEYPTTEESDKIKWKSRTRRSFNQTTTRETESQGSDSNKQQNKQQNAQAHIYTPYPCSLWVSHDQMQNRNKWLVLRPCQRTCSLLGLEFGNPTYTWTRLHIQLISCVLGVAG